MAKSEKRTRAAQSRGSSHVITQLELSTPQCVAVLAILVAVFFHKILLQESFFWEDFIYQNFPFRNFAATSLASGQLPLWNPYTFNGMPFLADIQTTVLYIPCLLLTLFVHDGSLNFYWLELVIILHFLLAGVGMFFLAKSFTMRNLPSLFAGAAYMLSGYMIVHAIHQQNVTLVAWYPLVLLLFRKALTETRWLYVFVCGLVLGHSIFAGYPQLSLFLYFLLGLFFLMEFLTTFPMKKLNSPPALIMAAKALTIVVISIALAMIQLLPTFELSGLSQRAAITFEKASEGSLAWSQLATLYFPKMFGTSGANGFEYFGPGQYFYYWETCVYSGLLPLLLAAASFALAKKDKYVTFFLAIAAFSLVFALGNNTPVFNIFYSFVPGFSKFRIPARMGILLTFAVSLLAAFSLNHLFYKEKTAAQRNAMRTGILIAFGLGVIVYALVMSGSFENSMTNVRFAQAKELVSKGVTPSLVILLISAALTFGIVVKDGLFKFAGILLVVILFADMFTFGGNQNNGTNNPSEYFRRRSDLVNFFKQEGAKELFRVNTRNAQGILPGWDRNQGMIDRIFMMEGYTPLALQRAYAPLASNDQSYDLLNVKYKTITDPQTGNLQLVEHPTRLPRAFFVYKTHVSTNEEELLAYVKSPDFDHRTTAVIEKELGRPLTNASPAPAWDARITHYANNSISISAKTTADGLLVLSEIFYPGWKAYIDGSETEIYRTDYNLRGIFVGTGEHSVEVRFEPSTFRTGTWISIVTLLLCVAGIFVSYSRQHRSSIPADVAR